MVIFKVKGRAIEDLPEIELDAPTREEAEQKYLRMFEDGLIESDHVDIDFYERSEEGVDDDDDLDEEYDEDDDDVEEGDDYVEGEVLGSEDDDFEEYDEGEDDDDYEDEDSEDDEELPDPKIKHIELHQLPHEVWDHIDHTDFYLEQGYVVFEMGKEGTNNEFNYLYRRKGVSQSSAGNDMSGGSGSESSMGNGSSSESTMGGSNNMSSGGSENRENSFGQHNTGSGYGGGHSGFSSQ